MAGTALNREQFTAYAWAQIATATSLLAEHRVTSQVACGCGRPLPCPQAGSLAATRMHYRQQIERLEATQPLPVLAPSAPAARHCRRVASALLARLWRSPRRGDV